MHVNRCPRPSVVCPHRPALGGAGRRTAAVLGRLAELRGRPDGRESGSIVAVLVLLVALAVVALVAAATVGNGFGIASRAQQSEQAIAAANAGVSDALFHLDQMGDNVESFCLGTPPAGYSLPAGVTSCLPGLATVRGLRYYALDALSNEKALLTSIGVVGGERRVVTVTLYRVLDQFGIFGVTGMSWRGNFSQAFVEEVGANGQPVGAGGDIYLGVGPGGSVVCTANGNGSGPSGNGTVIVVGEKGSQIGDKCPNPSPQSTGLTPEDPTVCAPGQQSTAFAPCIDTSSFAVEPASARNPGSRYCPIPGVTGLVNGIQAWDPPAGSVPSGATFDCDTNGGPVNVSAGGGQTLPPGDYYVTANSANVGPLPASALSGPTNFFVLPAACTGSSCAPATPSSPNPSSGCASTSPPSVSLSLTGGINVSGQTPGNPENLGVYWGGCGSINVGTGANSADFVGYLYAPGGVIYSDGGKFVVVGAMVVNSYTINGAPNFTYVYPEHDAMYVQGWTESQYQITP